jgi:hypothetical protein
MLADFVSAIEFAISRASIPIWRRRPVVAALKPQKYKPSFAG